jgi:hypothetical protein
MLLLHGALMLEGPPKLMLTGQKDVLGGTFCDQLPWGEGPITHLIHLYILHMWLHGALMLEGSPTMMWTEEENILLRGSVLINIIKGMAILLT